MSQQPVYRPIFDETKPVFTTTTGGPAQVIYTTTSPLRSTSSGIKGLLVDLLEARRARFNYLNPRKPGQLKPGTYFLYALNALASAIGIPLLFLISFYAITLHQMAGVQSMDMLSVMFFGIAIAILIDFVFGYIYDRLVKRGLAWLKTVFILLGNIGLIFSVLTMFTVSSDMPTARKNFRISIILVSIFYSLANPNNFKNVANLTPSQEHRSRILFLEYWVKSILILVFVASPFWIKFFTPDCTCGATCQANPTGGQCTGCISNCDTPNQTNIQNMAKLFTFIFAVANVLVSLIIHPRHDATVEVMPTSYNRRVNELTRNYIWLKSFFATLVQHYLLFGFAFWIGYYLDAQAQYDPNCPGFWGSSSYICTKSSMKVWSLIILCIAACCGFLISFVKLHFKLFTVYIHFTLILVGLLLIFIGNNSLVIYRVTTVFFAVWFMSFPATNVLYTNSMYYDEYLSGSTHPYLQAALYNTAVKIGFFIVLAFQLCVKDILIVLVGNTDVPTFIFGITFLLAAIILVILGFQLNQYDLQAFDKIHVAIERNLSDATEVLNFYDPVEKKAIRRPVISHNAQERKCIALLYNLDPRDDLKYAVYGNHEKLQGIAFCRMLAWALLCIVSTVLVIVFASSLNSRIGWLTAIPLALIPFATLKFLYNYNTWSTAHALHQGKYKNLERAVVTRFIPLLYEKDRLAVTATAETVVA